VGGGARGHVVTPRALLAADCGRGVGLGHLERMLALADALRPDVEVLLVVPEGDATLHQRVSARGHTAIDARGDTATRVATVAGMTSFDVVVLDGYVFDVVLQRSLRERAPLTVVDDLRLPAECDLAVNPSPGGEQLHPAGASTFLGGAAYALIRASVVAAREIALRRPREGRTVLVSTGATDPMGIGETVSSTLLGADGVVEVIRVIGPDSTATSPDAGRREHLLMAPPDLGGALATATVYVGAAGTTAVQAACVGIPAVIAALATNQQAQASALNAAGCAIAVDAADLAVTCLTLLDDSERRATMATRGRELVDGHGAARVAAAIRDLVATRAA
jgi:UDP-2,4-diacetamido-2,4,6-trideoxy-beta-L-altropyranose hydrolase